VTSLYSKTLVVMPAFNEEATVGSVVDEVLTKLPGIHVLVIDDGSGDATAESAWKAGALVATLPFNLGVGAAMRTGFRYALENGYDNVVQVDADGQHDPDSLPSLLAALGEADLVLGARFAGQGEYRASGPRRWAMVMLAAIISRTVKSKLTDTTSGYRASGPRAVALFAQQYPAEYLGDTIETLVIAARSHLVVRQVPVAMRPRAGGVASHNPFRSAAYLGRVMLALAFAFIRPISARDAGGTR
jgi:glycosyltransferase involved in cell wall biosynthesis